MMLRVLAASALLAIMGPIAGLGVFGVVALNGYGSEFETPERIALTESTKMAGLATPNDPIELSLQTDGPIIGIVKTESVTQSDSECDRLR